ncbi:MAG: glycosyltransferase family 39 protein [bacterium]|nr:glycosyltransferase family 39 protein [bacterium]
MDKRALITIFLFAFILRLAAFDFFIWRSGPEGLYLVDATHYTTLAKNIVEGHGFSLSAVAPYAPDAYRTPGYPVFLAVFYKVFGTFWPANLFQVFLNALVPVMILWLAWKASGSRSVAYVAGFLTAVEPHLIYHQVGIATEGIFIFLLALFAVAVVRYLDIPTPGRAVVAGALFAISSITRPYFLYFLPIVIIFLIFPLAWRNWKSAIAACVLFLIPSFLIIFPWMMRNERVFGVFTLSTSGWYNVYTRLGATVYAAATNQQFNPVFNNFLTQLGRDGVTARGTDEELYDPRVAPELKKRALAIFKQYPLQMMLLQPLSVYTIFTHDNLLTMLNEMRLLPYPKRPPIPLSMALLQEHPLRAIGEIIPYIRGTYVIPFVMRAIWSFLLFCAICGTWVLFANPSSPRAPFWIRFLKFTGLRVLPLGKGEVPPIPPFLKEVPERRRISAFFFAALILFFVVVTLPIGAAIDARMRMAFEPIYFIFVAAGLVLLTEKMRLLKTETA